MPTIFDESLCVLYKNLSEADCLFGYGLRYYAHELNGNKELSERERAEKLYHRAFHTMGTYRPGTEQRAASVKLCRELKDLLVNYHEPKQVKQEWPDYQHGTKPGAYQRKVNERGLWPEYWTEHRISKCWKDQRGKGRNKRLNQYRPVEFYPVNRAKAL